jgi:hypothetical protein
MYFPGNAMLMGIFGLTYKEFAVFVAKKLKMAL